MNDREPIESSPAAWVYPQVFTPHQSTTAPYLSDPLSQRLFDFFAAKGLAAIKEEDRREQWYADWIAYQTEHRIYAQLLVPGRLSTLGTQFNLLRLTRFLEVFAYCSPAHGYSLQVTFLGLFSILMGTSETLKREAVALLERGGLLAFGISEKEHGSDLLSTEFAIRELPGGPGVPARFLAEGSKHYIGNAESASLISILARKEDRRMLERGGARRAPLVLFALRPPQSSGFKNVTKIRTLGVRAASVGSFEVKNHELPETDILAEGRAAWDAIFGTVTLGKFFLGFGSIGICEHALAEASVHLTRRILYGKPAIAMPHLRTAMCHAYARLLGMKLYAYRALDYVSAASIDDRRYLLYTAVQKARVSTEGVKVMALLSECVGARGFESETFFEMALRDAQLIPGLEGSAHINLGLAAQFIPRYLGNPVPALMPAPSLTADGVTGKENPYLMEARMGALTSISFPRYRQAFRRWISVDNVRLFVRQTKAFRVFLRREAVRLLADDEASLALGAFVATIAYAQLIAENSAYLDVEPAMVAAMFHALVLDLSANALALAALPQVGEAGRRLLQRAVAVPQTRAADWNVVAGQLTGLAT